MAKLDFTVVYVFGPERCSEKYLNDELLLRDAGEWVKIGETQYHADIKDVTEESMKEVAMKRICNEPRTGIPDTSKLYDVFIFPFRSHTDDRIRKRLCSDMFDILNSKQINREIKGNKELIKAGEEFVYNVTRSKIKYAVQSFDHELIAQADNDEKIMLLAQICRCNEIDIDTNNSTYEEENTALVKRKPNLDMDSIFAEDENAEIKLVNSRGEDVLDENGEPIIATYVGGNKFDCRDVIGRTSPLAKKYLNEYAGMNLSSVNGNEFWTYKGKKLTSYRNNN